MKIIISGNSVVHWCVLIVSGLQWSSTALREKRCQSLIRPCVLLQDGLSKSDMEKLTFYAVSAPEKLDRIGAYLAERLSRDVVRHRYGWASTSPRLFFFLFSFAAEGGWVCFHKQTQAEHLWPAVTSTSPDLSLIGQARKHRDLPRAAEIVQLPPAWRQVFWCLVGFMKPLSEHLEKYTCYLTIINTFNPRYDANRKC